MIEVVPAGAGDLPVASEILVEAARWLISRGEPLWRPDDLSPDRLRPDLELGRLHLGRLRGEAVGTICLQDEDELFWPEARPGASLFFHRLAVRRRVAGTGVGAALVAFAEARARRLGRRWLRLDCSARHPGLARYYERLGFELHSEGRLGAWHFLRYQKALRVDSPG